jgi:hypothetical protein
MYSGKVRSASRKTTSWAQGEVGREEGGVMASHSGHDLPVELLNFPHDVLGRIGIAGVSREANEMGLRSFQFPQELPVEPHIEDLDLMPLDSGRQVLELQGLSPGRGDQFRVWGRFDKQDSHRVLLFTWDNREEIRWLLGAPGDFPRNDIEGPGGKLL